MEKHQQNIESSKSDKLMWLANQIFAAFPGEVTGLKFYLLDCGCIHYQRVYGNGDLDPQISIYRNAVDGACEVCMLKDKAWKERLIDETIVYNNRLEVIKDRGCLGVLRGIFKWSLNVHLT